MSTQLKNLVLVGKLSIANWEAKKKARSVEAKAEAEAGTVKGAVSARKSLLPGAEKLEAIINHSKAMSRWWSDVSAPWFDNGMRVYNVAGHIDIQTAYGDMARYRDQLVNEFMDEYPALREKARFDLNELFDEQDYPMPESVRAKFRTSLEIMPLPDINDFRVIPGLDEAEAELLVEEAQRKSAERMQEALQTTVTRVLDVLRTLADRLAAYTEKETADVKGNRFYESWVDNVKEIAQLLPQLNLTNDPAINALANEIAGAFDKPALHYRDNSEDRATATQRANELTRKLAGLFGN
jgi:hypothetical protein